MAGNQRKASTLYNNHRDGSGGAAAIAIAAIAIAIAIAITDDQGKAR